MTLTSYCSAISVGQTGLVLLEPTKASGIKFPSTFYGAAAQEYRKELFKLLGLLRDTASSIATPQTRQCPVLVHTPSF